VREKRPDAVMIFVQAPSLEETRKRLQGRATEDEKALEARMTTALTEVSARGEFDYEVVNSDREKAREAFIRIMQDIVGGGIRDAARA
jgi:guanylate kinase